MMIETNKIYCMDCVSGMSLLDKGSIDLVFTSPPYYNAKEYSIYDSYQDYLEFMCSVISNIHTIISEDGFFILNTSPVIIPRESRNRESIRLPIPFDTFSIAQDAGFKYIDDIIWEKPDGASGGRGRKFAQNRRPLSYKPFTVTEHLFVFRKKDAPLIDYGIRKHSSEIISQSLVLGEYERTNVWKINPETGSSHPAPFPYALAEKVIRYYSYVGDLVLDPFMGSGTTAVVAKDLGRNYIGFESSQEYVDASNRSQNDYPIPRSCHRR